MGRTHTGQLVENCLQWEGPHAGAGAETEESSPEEEGAAETKRDELISASIPCRPALLRGRRDRIGSKVQPGEKGGLGGGGGRCF